MMRFTTAARRPTRYAVKTLGLMLGISSLLIEPSLAAAKQRIAKDPAIARKAQLGQFMTPREVAYYMASSFDASRFERVRLLDAGAGQGALSLAFARRWASEARAGSSLAIDAYELDPAMVSKLREGLATLRDMPGASSRITAGDFIAEAAGMLSRGERPFTHAILNPPYKKISSDSQARALLSSAGIETVNLYSGFVALALKLMQDQGELVAIIPRSFCNGPYYRSFREILLDNAAIVSIHLFKARDKAFAADNVLQENVIIHLKRGAVQGDVDISTSADASFSDVNKRRVPFSQIVTGEDKSRVIHVPIDANGAALANMPAYRTSLEELGIQVSTGPVVDFRLKRFLRDVPSAGDAPLLYPLHFSGGRFEWPRLGARKPNALAMNAETSRLVYPRGFYVVVRRFSSKEEVRRIVASLVDPVLLPEPWVAFENHLNVFHSGKKPLSEELARGLSVYLNSKIVDDWLRNFSGHTQVNATDLRSLPLPSRSRLQALGKWAGKAPTQAQIDTLVADPK
jgi:adenine-specific DNA-methyltransferase